MELRWCTLEGYAELVFMYKSLWPKMLRSYCADDLLVRNGCPGIKVLIGVTVIF
jgi:hypothetical protein